MRIPFFKHSPRINRMEHLAQQLTKLLDVDFPAAYKCDNSDVASQRIRIKDEEQLIKTELSALRLLQAEERLVHRLLIPILSSISLVVGALVGYFFKLIF